MNAREFKRIIQETKEALVELLNAFQQMVDNTDEKKERAFLEKIKKALLEYKTKRTVCEKNGLKVEINIDPAAIKIKMTNPPFEAQLTSKDLKIFKGMKILIEEF